MKKDIETFLLRLPLVDIQMGKEEIKSIKEVIDSGWVTQGSKVQLFEEMFAKFIGTKYAVATSSCTSALQIALDELDLSERDEVITSPFTWESTITAILYAGGAPVFADIDPDTFNISPSSILEKITKRTKGIVVVHYAGLPCNMKRINEISKKYNLFVLEDSAHALGSEYEGKKTGSMSDAGCFSFGSTKTITTGEGGMITTNSKKRYKRYKILRNYGETKSSIDKKSRGRWVYDIVMLSYNFKMNEFGAAIGVEQMKKLPNIISERKTALKLYQKYLLKSKLIKTQKIPNDVSWVPLFYPIVLQKASEITRLKIMKDLENKGIETMVYYPPVYKMSVFKRLFQERRIVCPVTESISSSIFSIPCHSKLKEMHITAINEILKKHLIKSSRQY